MTFQDRLDDGSSAEIAVPELLSDRPGQLSPGLCSQGGVAATQIEVITLQSAKKAAKAQAHPHDLLKYHDPEISFFEQWCSHQKTDLWVQIRGLADLKKIESVLTSLSIRSDLIPFLITTPQPSQIKIYNNSILIVLHQLSVSPQNPTRLESNQVALLLFNGILVSVEEGPDDSICRPVVKFIRRNLDQKDAINLDNIMHFIVDEILDSYPPMFQHLSDYLDELEELALHSQSQSILSKLSLTRCNLRKCRQQLIALQTDLIPLFHARHDLITPMASRGFRDIDFLDINLGNSK